MENFKIIKAQLAALKESRECYRVDMMVSNSVKECEVVSAKIAEVSFKINELEDLLKTKIHVSVEEPFRCFSKCEFDIPIRLGSVNYIVGGNGCGKTTVLHKIRAINDSLRELNLSDRDGMHSVNLDLVKCEPMEVSGIDGTFTHVFALDSIEDDPSNYINSATAFGFAANGGLTVQHRSKGEKSKFMLGSLFSKMQSVLGFDIEKYKNGENIKDCTPLILIDEVDEGIDFKSMMLFDKMLSNVCNIFNATIMCVTHNPLVCYGSEDGENCPVFDISIMKETTIAEFTKRETGVEISVKKEKTDK